MPYKYQLSEEAKNDVMEAYEWYEKRRTGLGEEFLACLDSAKDAIINNPMTYRVCFKKKVRRFVVHTFPYLVLYIANKKTLMLLRSSTPTSILVNRRKEFSEECLAMAK